MSRLQEISDLRAAEALLYWDQATYMPPGGAAARGRQLATLTELSHQKLVDPAIGRLLDTLEPALSDRPDDDDEAAMVRIARRDFEQATKTPPAFMAEVANHMAVSYNRWAEARTGQ